MSCDVWFVNKGRDSSDWKLTISFVPTTPPLPAEYSATEERIVGGGSAMLGQFPFIASLRSVSSDSHFCGGTIITARYILTAAHCLDDKVALNVKVVTGSILLSSGGASYSVSSMVSHPNFNKYTFLNDIAVVKTTSSISFSEQVQPIGISGNFVEHNQNAVALGWGMTTVSWSWMMTMMMKFLNLFVGLKSRFWTTPRIDCSGSIW